MLFLERAIALAAPDDELRGALLPELGVSLFEAGRMTEAAQVLDDAIAHASGPAARARARVEREFVRLETETSAGTQDGLRVSDAVMPIFARETDDRGRSRAWSLRARSAYEAGRLRSADEAWQTAADFARRAGDQRELFDVIEWRATAAVYGPMPVPEAIRSCQTYGEIVAPSPRSSASILNALAVLHAMDGDFERADRHLRDANAILDEFGGLASHVPHYEAIVGMLSGHPERAEAVLRADIGPLESMRGTSTLATTTAMLAQAVFAQGRVDEAAELCRTTAHTTATDDVFTQVMYLGVQAKCLARAGRCADAERMARAAITLAEPTDLLSLQADAMLDLVEVLRTCAQTDAADHALGASLVLCRLKGNSAAAANALAANEESE